jgi:DNA-binding MarR family transcriptional regulator
VSSLCIAAAVPPTTALRWIRQLTDRGILIRQADPVDGRRVFIALSDEAAEAISRWFTAIRPSLDMANGQQGA